MAPQIVRVDNARLARTRVVTGTAAISLRTTDGDSNYNSMHAILRRRFRKGLFDFNWTWAKGIDDMGNSLQVSVARHRELRPRPRRQRLRPPPHPPNELDVGLARSARPGHAVAGGWRLSGIWTDYSGRRFTPAINNTGLANTRPDHVWGVAANLPSSERSLWRWFNPAAFTAPLSICGPRARRPASGMRGAKSW